MEIYQLRTFKMVAEEGHLTRAAKRLHASQPAVSAHIKSLEEELGISLFLRTPKGMILTSDGRKLKEHADKALLVINDMAVEAKNLRKTLNGVLRIGINAEPDSIRIPELFTVMKLQYPNLHLHLLQSMTGEVLNKLEDGVLDAGFIYGQNESPRLFTIQLKQQRLVVAGPKIWQDRLNKARPEDLGQFPWIMTPVDCSFYTIISEFFKKYRLCPSQVAVIDQETIMRTMIKAEVGLSLLLEEDALRDAGELAVWRQEDLFLQLSIACLDKRRDEPMLQALFSLLTGIWEEPRS
jgi:DNA-binding transcriptional LysR family regulator